MSFVGTVLLGRKIAIDKDFREKYVPSWYDFTVSKPESSMTRQDLHETLVSMQTELHERAIRGEFTPEKLEEMRRQFKAMDPESDDDDE